MTTTDQLLIGPLTAEEWASFALGDDDRNPMPPCCGNVSDVRDAIFDALRLGGDPAIVWRRVASVWDLAEDHGLTEHPTMRKLFDAYVAGRDRPNVDEGFAHLLARTEQDALLFVDTVPESWDVDTREGRTRALTRIGGRFVGYVLDPDARYRCAERLAGILGLDELDVCDAIDMLRLTNGLPYEVTHPDERAAEQALHG